MEIKEITYESEMKRLNDELIYYMNEDIWPYVKECFLSYCNLEDEDKKRIVKLDKKIQSRPESKLNKKDDVLLCASYYLNNSKEFCDSLSDDELLLYTEYYLHTAIANPRLGQDKKELLELSCEMSKELSERIFIMQIGEKLLDDRKYNFHSVSEVCNYIKNTSTEELNDASVFYINECMNDKEMQDFARKVNL